MNYTELKQTFQELKATSPGVDLTAYIIFTEDSFAAAYPLLSRTYSFSSDNKAFWPNLGGYSIFAYCLDKTSDQGVRLDRYMAEEENPGGWKVDTCYILEQMQDVGAIPYAVRTGQNDGTVCYFFGDTCIRVRESHEDGKIHLEPLAGDQAACDKRVELPIDRVCGYCTLLEQHLNGKTENGNEALGHYMEFAAVPKGGDHEQDKDSASQPEGVGERDRLPRPYWLVPDEGGPQMGGGG